MKKYFILAVAAVVALAACTKTTIDPVSQEARVINFNTVTKKAATKAPISGTVYHCDAPDFGVFAWYLAPTTSGDDSTTPDWNTAAENTTAVDYMGSLSAGSLTNAIRISFDDGKDIWAPYNGSAFINYYWPLQGKLTFVAYSPITGTGAPSSATFSKAGVLTLNDFTVQTTVASQVDLLYSNVAADKNANESYYTDSDNSKNSQTAGNDKGVNIQFKHALSQIVFRAKAAEDIYTNRGLSFKVNSLTVHAANAATSMAIANPGLTGGETVPTWTLVSPVTYDNFVVNDTDHKFPNNTTGAESSAGEKYLTNDFTTGFIGKGMISSESTENPLLMIPVGDVTVEAQTKHFANTDPYFTINYTLYRRADGVDMGTKEVTIHFSDIAEKTGAVALSWEAGKKYVYDLTIDLQKIYFTPSILDWDADISGNGSVGNEDYQSVDVPNDQPTV